MSELSENERDDAVTDQTQSFPGVFCEPCNKWRKPDAIMPDGTCPKCRAQLEDPVVAAAGTEQAVAEAPKIPWHFWVMVAATVIYLGWRVIQGVGSLF